jgi:hypothetical protein
MPPALDRLPHRKVEVIDFLPDDEVDAADHMRDIISTVELDIKNISPQTQVGINAEVGFAHSDKDGEMENGIRGQLPELDPVGKKEVTKKFMGWKGKPTL